MKCGGREKAREGPGRARGVQEETGGGGRRLDVEFWGGIGRSLLCGALRGLITPSLSWHLLRQALLRARQTEKSKTPPSIHREGGTLTAPENSAGGHAAGGHAGPSGSTDRGKPHSAYGRFGSGGDI